MIIWKTKEGYLSVKIYLLSELMEQDMTKIKIRSVIINSKEPNPFIK